MKSDACRHVFATMILVAGVVLLPAHAIAAGGAFVVDDVEIGKPGDCKVESSASFASNHDFLGVVSPACVVNLGRPVELGFSLARSRSDGEWGTALVLKGKTNISPVGPGSLGLAISGATAFDLLTGENSASQVNIPVTFQIIEQFKINLNAGWLYERQENLHWFTYGAGFEWSLVKPVTLIGEVFGLVGQRVEPSARTDPRGQIGLRFTPVDNLDIDVIYGRNIAGENAHWGTVGVNLRF
jgi:hypothetical protein